MSLADSIATRAQTLGKQVISNLSPLYENGVFYQNVMDTFTVNTLAPAALMATLVKYEPSGSTLSPTYLRLINEIVVRMLATNTTAAGLLVDGGSVQFDYGQGPSRASMGSTFSDLNAIDATANLAWILYQLPANALDASLRQSWVAVCQANCKYLDTRPDTGVSNTTYYVNGNWQIHLLNAYWLTAVVSSASDRATYEDMYERALKFIYAPTPTSRWNGYGLVKDTPGAQYDWSDYIVHLTETNGNSVVPPAGNTFDPNYSAFQAALLARLFVVNRDWRIIRLLNGISNKLAPLLIDSTTTWVLNGTGGSRQNNNSFDYSYWIVQALVGVKSLNATLLDTTHILALWDNAVISNTTNNSTTGFYAPGQMRQLGVQLAAVREAANVAALKVAAS